jgi:hypothetical protein
MKTLNVAQTKQLFYLTDQLRDTLFRVEKIFPEAYALIDIGHSEITEIRDILLSVALSDVAVEDAMWDSAVASPGGDLSTCNKADSRRAPTAAECRAIVGKIEGVKP